MQRVALLFSMVLLVFAPVGCSQSFTKQLTEASGRSLLKETIAAKDYTVALSSIEPLLVRSQKDYTTSSWGGMEGVVSECVKRNLIRQKVETFTYPKITGAFSTKINFGVNDSGVLMWSKYTWVLDTLPDPALYVGTDNFTRSLWTSALGHLEGPTVRVTGAWYEERYDTLGASPPRNVQGAIATNGKVILFVDRLPFQFPGTWEARYREEGASAYLEPPGRDVTGAQNAGYPPIVGRATGQKLAVKWYEYSFTPELEKRIVRIRQGAYIAAGKFDIGELSGLKLASETLAVADFSWKVSPNDLGSIFFGHVERKGSGTVRFAKKPDGTWFVDGISLAGYQPPQ